MSLTAGATLQNQKYAIHKQLHQSDFGVTYQAQHSILGRSVVLQTLNDALRQRDDFAQLRQQFLSRVRAISQQPVGNLHVLDCFEEAGLPFVVFELAAGQPLPQFSDWIPVTPPAPSPEAPEAPLPASLESGPESSLESGLKSGLESSLESRLDALAPASGATPSLEISQSRIPVSEVLNGPNHHTGQTPAHTIKLPAVAPARPMPERLAPTPRRAWMPMALVFVSMLGGLLGVGLGFTWRFSAAQTPRQLENGSSATSPEPANLAPRLFSREQSFPSGPDWPISEQPQLFTPPAPIAPSYPSQSQLEPPPYRPLPSEANVPELPAPQPLPQPSAAPSPSPSPLAPIPPSPPALGNAATPDPIQIAPPIDLSPEPPPAPPEPPLPAPEPVEPLPKQPEVFQN